MGEVIVRLQKDQAEQDASMDTESQTTAEARSETEITTDVQAKLYSDQMLRDKRIENPWRKHGNIPL